MDNVLTLTVNGTDFTDWTSLSVTRALDRSCADFDIEVTERAIGQIPWQLMPFTPCKIALNGKLLLTGYIDVYAPRGDAASHSVTIRGRSKTSNLVDCSVDIKGGQFAGYKLDAICRSICAPFGISVIVQTDIGNAFANVQARRDDNCFAFLERLCRLRGVLATDDENGNLVLTTAGTARAAGSLQEGKNIKAYNGSLTGGGRFSHYAVIGQRPVDDDTSGKAANEVEGAADDPGVPIYKPFVVMAESALDPATAQLRATWQARVNAARSVEATITVPGWQQPNGSLWAVNQIVSVHAPQFLKLDRDLLIVKATFRMNGESGSSTELTVAPQEGWTPEQVSPRRLKVKGQAKIWHDVVTLKSETFQT